MDLHTYPHIKSGSDDGVNQVAKPASAYPRQITLMRPVGCELLILECFGSDHLDGEVLVLRHVDHLDVVAVDSFTKDEKTI